jgi:hypothetical protein
MQIAGSSVAADFPQYVAADFPQYKVFEHCIPLDSALPLPRVAGRHIVFLRKEDRFHGGPGSR